jgi:hypothetical protein
VNNIQKAFKKKSELRAMADGGPAVLRGSYFGGRQQQLEEALGDLAAPPRTAAPAPRRAPAGKPDFSNVQSGATSVPASKPKGALRRFLGLADGGDVGRIMHSRDMSIFTPEEKKTFNAMGAAAQEQALALQQAGHRAGLAAAEVAPPQMDFGVSTAGLEPPEQELADGGNVKGKGGPTDDKVGPVALSDGEYVLPADTVEAVGVETLDALRLATHDFKDAKNRPKIPGRLRGMASGGVFYVDPEGNASRGTQPPGRAMVPARSNLPMSAQPQPAAPASGAGATPRVTATPVPPQTGGNSALRSAATGGGRVGGFLRGVAPIQMAMGAAGTFGDQRSGYRDEYNRQLGIDRNASLPKQVAGDTARVMENVGDTLTFGVAGKLGRGLGSLAAGGSFMEGWSGPSQRERFAASQNQPAAAPTQPQGPTPVADVLGSSAMADETNRRTGGGADGVYPGAMENRSGLSNAALAGADPNSYYASRGDNAVVGTFNGREITKREADARAAGMSTISGHATPQNQPSDPFMDEVRSALRNAGGGGGGWSPPSREREINERYDKLANQLSGMYSRKGQGNLARRLLELEQSRSAALDADARNQSSLRGQNVNAQTANLNARMSALSTMGTLEAQRRRDAAAAAAAGGKAAAAAAKAAEERDERGLTDIREAVRARFGEDSALAESVLSRILSAGEGQISRITSLTGQDRAAAIEDMLDSAMLAQQFDASQNPLWGDTDAGLPRVTEVRDPRFFRDVGSGAAVLPALGRELKDLVGFDGRVMVDDNGRVAPYPDDLRSRRVARNAEADAPRRSRLRSERED